MNPKKSLDGFNWDAQRREFSAIRELDVWKGYECENSIPTLKGSKVKLRICTAESASIDEVTTKHVFAMQWLMDHQKELHDAIIETLFIYYQKMWAEYPDYMQDDPSLNVTSPLDFKHLIDLTYVDIFPFQKESLPYFGFEFECAWDPEHGFQILMNGLRVVDLGGDGNNEYEIGIDGGID